jgi:hypothetical protein
MVKPVEMHAPAKALEHAELRGGDAILIETEKINRVAAGQLAEHMERALKRAARDGEGRVGVNNEDTHGRGGVRRGAKRQSGCGGIAKNNRTRISC